MSVASPIIPAPADVGPAWPPRLAEVLLAAAVLLAGAWFYNGMAWNQIARYDTIFACVEPGPGQGGFAIDRFLPDPERWVNTGDWARNPARGPHYYANKAPGPMLLGIPAYAALYRLECAAGLAPETPELTATNGYLLNLLLTVLPLALSSIAFWRLATAWSGGRRGWGLLLTVALYFGTPLWPFATQLWGHATAAAWVVLGWYCLQRATRAGDVWGGWWLGLAVLTEYSTALLVPGWVLLWLVRRQPRRVLALVAPAARCRPWPSWPTTGSASASS